MIRYYASGFDNNNAFIHGMGDMLKKELKDTKSIVYIPGGIQKLTKTKEVYLPAFTNHFKNIGITFAKSILITPDIDKEAAKRAIKEADFIMLMGGDPFEQKTMCQDLEILDELKEYQGIMMGFSAGAMLMSKYIIVTPCSEEYPDFHIEEGLNLDGISIYPHNNTDEDEYPDILITDDETYKKDDLIKVAKEYGEYYLLQDNYHEDGKVDISYIKSFNGIIEYYTENNGKIWKATKDDIILMHKKGFNYEQNMSKLWHANRK